MDKKVIGLLILSIIAIVAISGCIADDDSNNTESDNTNYIGEEKAIEIAENSTDDIHSPDASLTENNDGIKIYSILFKDEDGHYYTVEVDAKTGEIIKSGP